MKELTFKNTKTGRKINVVFGYDVEGDFYGNYSDARKRLWEKYPVIYNAFCYCPDSDFPCLEALYDGFACSKALTAEEKNTFNKRFIEMLQDEGWTLIA